MLCTWMLYNFFPVFIFLGALDTENTFIHIKISGFYQDIIDDDLSLMLGSVFFSLK